MKILCAIGLLTMVFSQAFCETDCCAYEQEDPCNFSCLQIGGNYTHAHVKTHNHSSFHGNLGGIQGSYEYKPRNNIYGGLKVSWKEGKTETSRAKRHLIYIDAQERLGYTFTTPCRDLSLTLFSGFGYRYLGHKLKQSSHRTIKFDYNEFYVPVGFLLDYSFNSCWALGINLTWMPQVYPTVKIVPLKGARWIIKNRINNFLVELPITFFLAQNKRFSVMLKPFYEYWEDGRSTAKTARGNALNLPGNTYNFYGAELNFAFSF